MDTLDRLVAIERKLDAVIGIEEVGSNAPSTASDPARPAGSPLRTLALDIGADRLLLPRAVEVERRLTEDGEEIAVGLRIRHLRFTIEEAVRLGVLGLDGRFNHYRASALLHAIPEPGSWVHPMGHAAAKPATRPRL